MEISAQPADSSPSQLNGADGELYQQLHSYPFTSDPEFKLGLAVILRQPGTPASDERINRTDDLVLKAKCFYFSRKQAIQPPLDFLSYRTWLQSHTPDNKQSQDHLSTQTATSSTSTEPQPVPTAAAPEPTPTNPASPSPSKEQPAYPSSFAHIVELITTGQPIPGIQHIPDTILAGKEGPSSAARRRKPWEKPEDSEAQGDQAKEAEMIESSVEGSGKVVLAGETK